jgi:hypothetical protein
MAASDLKDTGHPPRDREDASGLRSTCAESGRYKYPYPFPKDLVQISLERFTIGLHPGNADLLIGGTGASGRSGDRRSRHASPTPGLVRNPIVNRSKRTGARCCSDQGSFRTSRFRSLGVTAKTKTPHGAESGNAPPGSGGFRRVGQRSAAHHLEERPLHCERPTDPGEWKTKTLRRSRRQCYPGGIS